LRLSRQAGEAASAGYRTGAIARRRRSRVKRVQKTLWQQQQHELLQQLLAARPRVWGSELMTVTTRSSKSSTNSGVIVSVTCSLT